VANQITVTDGRVNTLIPTWTGLELWHASTQAGPFTLLVQIPYVLNQFTYTYLDSAGLRSDWYEVRTYGPGPIYSSFSPAWTDTLPYGQVSLQQIEQTVAPRCGPYRQETVTASPSNTTIQFDSLKSTIEFGGIEDMYVLRRGYMLDGTAVPGYVVSDRVRVAKTYTPTGGTVEVDRAYMTPPPANELVEFHHLEPTRELRASVLAGLKRCWFMDRVTVTLAGAAAERDLTASAFWITNPRQVYRAQYAPYNSLQQAREITWPHVFEKDGHIWLAAAPDPLPFGLLVSARRSHITWVNSADSLSGPILDLDTLSVDLAYAAAAGNIEAWRICPARIQASGQQGLIPTMQQAAQEFTSQASVAFHPPLRRVVLSAPFGSDTGRRPLNITAG
jgi:hypothetical protein